MLPACGNAPCPRDISRYIEKGNAANRARLWQAMEDDPEVRAEVLRFAPHPRASADYQAFLDHACDVDSRGI